MMNSVDFSDPDQAATALQAIIMMRMRKRRMKMMTITMMVMMTMMTMTMTMMVILPRCFLKWWVGVKRQRRHFPTSSPRPHYPPLVTFHTNIFTQILPIWGKFPNYLVLMTAAL